MAESKYSHLPEGVRNFILTKQSSRQWNNNNYRINGILRSDAFKWAFERSIPDPQDQSHTLYFSCTTLDDLKQIIDKQNPALWNKYPWKHYDVTSDVFTLDELKTYVAKKTAHLK